MGITCGNLGRLLFRQFASIRIRPLLFLFFDGIEFFLIVQFYLPDFLFRTFFPEIDFILLVLTAESQ